MNLLEELVAHSLAATVIHASSQEVLQSGAVTAFAADGLAQEALEILDVFDDWLDRGQPVVMVVVVVDVNVLILAVTARVTVGLLVLRHPLPVLGRANSLLELGEVLRRTVDGAGAVVVVVEHNLVDDGAAVGEQRNAAQDVLLLVVVIAAIITGVAAVITLAGAEIHAEAEGADPDGDGERAGRIVGVVAFAGVELGFAGRDEERGGVSFESHCWWLEWMADDEVIE